jgi:hypothetical protein
VIQQVQAMAQELRGTVRLLLELHPLIPRSEPSSSST